MAPKNPTETIKNLPLEEESGSEDEESGGSEEEEKEESSDEEEEEESSDEEEKEESSDEEDPQNSTCMQTSGVPVATKDVKNKTVSGESDSDHTQNIASLKRHEADSEDNSDSAPAKKKKKNDDNKSSDVAPPATTEKKTRFQRVFTKEDELALVKGMHEFFSDGGNMDGFPGYIESEISFNATEKQLVSKVGKMKKKYDNAVSRGKCGQDQEVFEWSSKIWGNEGVLASKSRLNLRGEEEIKERKVVKSEIVSFIRAEDSTFRGLEESILNACWDMIPEGPKKSLKEMEMKKLKAFKEELCVLRSGIVADTAKITFNDHASSSGGS